MLDAAFAAARPRPFTPAELPTRALDGSYPFLNHRSCAEWAPVVRLERAA
ncbi:hypothetical protein [Sphingomonas yantingensis]|uniref:Uncharacterized protein n=1 Tax=Sphingomonas yantingensis TaxID=1241761 RepID=A0A7W9AM62_9SPHN|nr:hypothetical protein [Sphingomonas yantingensis]MBB5697025.1 hypothetical protein [Sphingomonas yantingensis]